MSIFILDEDGKRIPIEDNNILQRCHDYDIFKKHTEILGDDQYLVISNCDEVYYHLYLNKDGILKLINELQVFIGNYFM